MTSMQEESFLDHSLDRVRVYPDRAADELKRRLIAQRADVTMAVPLTHAIARRLLRSSASALMTAEVQFTPVYVLRGGLLLRGACEEVHGRRASGVVVPRKDGPHSASIAYSNVPLFDGPVVLALLDFLIATGTTMACVIGSLLDQLTAAGRHEVSLHVIAPMATPEGLTRCTASCPDVTVHTIWHREAVDGNGRMVGPGFDVGDYAFGGMSTSRLAGA